MDQDDFNDFEHPTPTSMAEPPNPPTDNHPNGTIPNHQTNLLANQFFNFNPASINPSSSLATQSLESPFGEADSKELEDSYWPHLNKIMSENLPPHQPLLLNFQKTHSQSQHKVDVFDLSPTLFTQHTTQSLQNSTPIKVQLQAQDYADIKTLEISNNDQNIAITDLQTNQTFASLSMQTNWLEQTKPQQQKTVPTEPSLLLQSPLEQTAGNFQSFGMQSFNNEVVIKVEESKHRKQSDQFVFQEQRQPHKQPADEQARKESEEFVFQTQSVQHQSAPTYNLQPQQLYQAQSIQQPQNTTPQKTTITEDQFQFTSNQPFQNHNSPSNISQNLFTEPTLPQENKPTEPSNPVDQDDEFGDFEETATVEPPKMVTQNQQKTEYLLQIYEQSIPYGTNAASKKKELQQLIIGLPDFSKLLPWALQSQ